MCIFLLNSKKKLGQGSLPMQADGMKVPRENLSNMHGII